MLEYKKIPSDIVEKLKKTVWEYPYKIKRSYPYTKDWVEVDNSITEPINGFMISTGSTNFKFTKKFREVGGKEAIMNAWFELMGDETREWIEQNLPPYGEKIAWIRANIYGEGTSLSMHTDSLQEVKFDDFFGSEQVEGEESFITSTITLDRPADLVGGQTVVGDLIMLELLYARPIKLTKKTLEVFDSQIGDCYIWDSSLLHGVSEIKKGSRVSISIDKKPAKADERKNDHG